jgi:hypothetical protein
MKLLFGNIVAKLLGKRISKQDRFTKRFFSRIKLKIPLRTKECIKCNDEIRGQPVWRVKCYFPYKHRSYMWLCLCCAFTITEVGELVIKSYSHQVSDMHTLEARAASRALGLSA